MAVSQSGQAARGPAVGSVYLWLVALVSITVLGVLANEWQAGPTNPGLAIELVLLAVVAQHFPLPIGPQHKVDTSIAVYFACLLLFDLPEAVVLVGISQVLGQATLALRRVRGTSKRMRGARGVLFNTSQLVIAAALGGLVYQAFLPHHGPAPLGRFENLWALPAAAMTMQLTNTASVTLMVGLQLRRSPRQILHLMRQPPGLERVGLFLIGLIAALAGAQYPGAPLVMAVPAGILFLSQRRGLSLLSSEQNARAEAERAQTQLALLANASAALAASLDYQTTLQNAVGLAIPTLADACTINIGRGETATRWFSVVCGDASRAEHLRRLLRHYPSAPRGENAFLSELYPFVSEEHVVAWGLGAEALALVRELKPISAMLVPLIARGQTLGGLALYVAGSERKYDPADLAVAEDLAQRIALAIDNARLYEDQQQIVDRLQRVRGRLEATEQVKLLDDERKRIARELHDRVEQTFFSIGLRANALLASPQGSSAESWHAALADIRNSAKQGAEDLRAAIFALTRAEVHDLGLVRALWQLVREFQEKTGVEADLVESGAERRVTPEIAEVLHAVAREGLNNVEQHARATAVVVSLQFDPEAVTLTVQDDGIGASALVLDTLSESATRFGLSGVREQALLLRGSFTARSGDDGGFIVRARVPLGPDAEARITFAQSLPRSHPPPPGRGL